MFWQIFFWFRLGSHWETPTSIGTIELISEDKVIIRSFGFGSFILILYTQETT